MIRPELITPDALHVMEPSWKSNWFAPCKIKAFLLKNVYVAGEGIIFNQALEPFLPSLWPSRPELVAQHLRLDHTELRTISKGSRAMRFRNTDLLVNPSDLEAALDRI